VSIMKNRWISLLLLIVVAYFPGNAQEKVNPPQDTAGLPQPPDPELSVPAGTVISIVLSSYLNSRSSQVGDNFYADVVYPVFIQQRQVIPRGSVVRGSVTQVVRPGKIKGKGRIAVRIDNVLLPNGVNRDLVAAFRGIHGPGTETIDRKSETVTGGSSTGTDVGQIIGITSEGAFIGAMAGHGTAAGIGAGAGAALGLVTMLLTRGEDLVLQPGTQFDLELKQPIKFAYGEIDYSGGQLNSASRLPSAPVRNNNNNRNRRFMGIPWP
jgi:hypothetical protein